MNFFTSILKMAKEHEDRVMLFKQWSNVIGYEIDSEEQYEKARNGAPPEIVKNPRISALAWQIAKPSMFSENIDVMRMAEDLSKRFFENKNNYGKDPIKKTFL